MFKLWGLVATASLGMMLPVLAAGDGTAVGVNPEAVSRRGTSERVLVVGSDVLVGDRITTGPSGRVQLLFSDDTRIVVGPRSTLDIEAYLLRGGTASRFAVDALAGTFRFISGKSPSESYSITTPTATIAVRGTAFDLTVTRSTTRALLFSGALRVCQGSNCFDLNTRCEIGVTGVGGPKAVIWENDEHGTFATGFPLPNIQAAFRPDFRQSNAQACLNPPIDRGNESLSTSGSDGNSVPNSQTQTQGQGQTQFYTQNTTP